MQILITYRCFTPEDVYITQADWSNLFMESHQKLFQITDSNWRKEDYYKSKIHMSENNQKFYVTQQQQDTINTEATVKQFEKRFLKMLENYLGQHQGLQLY